MLRTRILICVSLCCSALALSAGQAWASHSQTLFFEGSSDLLKPQTREHVISQLQTLGVHALRVELGWYDVAPEANSPNRPNFEATNPASYNWEPYEWLMNKAKELHWKVLLTVSPPAPSWATANHSAPYITRPDAKDFKEFMTAVGHQYGSQVSMFAIWNEPNQPAFLLPQFNSNRSPASPRIYRSLFQAGYEGLQAAGISHPKVLMGETAPTGYDNAPPHEGLVHNVAPLAFLRGALCLNSRYKKSASCGSLPAYGYAHHAYTKATGPYYKPSGADNVTISVLSRLTHALDLAAKAHAIKAHMPVYLTEFGIQSYPNHELGVPVTTQAQYYAMAEKIAYENPRVAAFSQYLMSDDDLGGPSDSSALGGFVGFQTGLEYVNYTPKPLYYAFPVPLVVHRTHSGYQLWGLVRPAGKATTLTVLVRTKGSSQMHTLRTVHTNSAGYWTLNSKVKGTAWSVHWKSPSGTLYNGPPIAAY